MTMRRAAGTELLDQQRVFRLKCTRLYLVRPQELSQKTVPATQRSSCDTPAQSPSAIGQSAGSAGSGARGGGSSFRPESASGCAGSSFTLTSRMKKMVCGAERGMQGSIMCVVASSR